MITKNDLLLVELIEKASKEKNREAAQKVMVAINAFMSEPYTSVRKQIQALKI